MASAAENGQDKIRQEQGREKATNSSNLPETSEPNKRFVLRQVRLKNFVKFHEEQKLAFDENGVYYLIGVNQSGKSSIFEAIRRCLSYKYNASLSSAPDSTKDSIVVSKYETKNKDCLISFYIRKAAEDTVFIKGCVILDKNGFVTDYGLDHLQIEIDNTFTKMESVKDVPPEKDLFKPEAMEATDWLNILISWASNNCKKSCEQLLKEYLKGVVFTLAMRGVKPLQWTKSNKVRHKGANIAESSKRAEIIKWYLTEKHESNDRESKMYNSITNGLGGIYSLKENLIFVNNDLPIFKQSEGFLEAKICSVLLTENTFTTVGLEDPGTGMHVQMINRLRDKMTSEVTDKVVIVSTHNPSFIKPELVGKMFFLSRNEDGSCEIISGKTISGSRKLKSAIPGSVSADQFAILCFAEMAVFVEGPSDVQFMEAFTTYIRNKEPFPCDVHFFSMGGGKKLGHFRKCCKALKKRYCFILDADLEVEAKQIISNELKKEQSEPAEHVQGTPEIQNEVEETCFFWSYKTLEDLLFEGVLEFLRQNKIKVTEIKEILQRCVGRENISFTDGDTIRDIVKRKKKFKLFLDGEETFDDRIKLFEYIMSGSESNERFKDNTVRHDLTRCETFLKNIQR